MEFRKPPVPVLLLLLVGVLIPFIKWLVDLWIDYRWFSTEGYVAVWWTQWGTAIALQGVLWLAAFLFVYLNLRLTKGVVSQALQYAAQVEVTNPRLINLAEWLKIENVNKIFLFVSIAIGFFISQAAVGEWQRVLLALNPQPFGVLDPLFGIDISFYVFQLPLLEWTYLLWQGLVIITGILLVAVYQIANSFGFQRVGWRELPRARFHLAGIVALFLLGKTIGYRLDIYNLVYSPSGVTFGAGYTDVHAQLPAYNILMIIALLTAAMIGFALVRRQIRWAIYGIGTLFMASILVGQVYPTLIQRFQVEPNEFVMEKPYIDMNIKFTRLAFGLERIEHVPFNAKNDLQAADLTKNTDTLSNVRLWDWQPLQQTYSQLQEIRLYYKFKNIDIDRYMINGQPRQVMLSAREFDGASLPTTAQTWINQRLIYTHGYGVAMSPVNEVTSEGLPKFFLKDIPPKPSSSDIAITRPEIYFGETANDYVIVKTATKEFDYPAGDDNVYATYQEQAGLPVGGFFSKLLYAIHFKDLKLLLSSEILPESQLLMERNIMDRLQKTAPFLDFDSDPYLIIDQGRLLWVADAYTTSTQYPFAQPVKGQQVNYIRNAVKATVDAYTGKMNFYVSDIDDPIIASYQHIFPGMFQPLEAMSSNTKAHLRYPEELFKIQSQTYATYHMDDASIFYNREDEWNLPRLANDKQAQTMEPYYTVMRLPDGQKPEFILMTPYTPSKKDNMIAWMAARMDGDNYGKLLVYNFPKQELIYGPAQIEARIDQDSQISQNLTLWNQRGSSVIRGNLIVLPINHSLLYIQPLFLQSEQGKLPALRRVIAIYGEQVVMEETLDLALQKIFGLTRLSTDRTVPAEPNKIETMTVTVADLAGQARTTFDDAQNALKAGDWSGYGEKMKALQRLIEDLERRTRAQ
ncbi:UPF0182 family protein [Heliophilum fasciatum]|uniref:UPF0182 protein EDD73_12424 n=1 Tax=Heliophilum fasciatum TaxID=35700 RepID=A0A4R2RET6_9FIRM|nr:UPF0182 family protein [Heliophilum fasciatum]MCW2278917.1 uncharacterized membrane protein (UPF0182 family) [Heliophilum fasciatum]TCP62050.1 hypothetical protein EDD73_12424 [Heliophilum fasciatum]